MIDSDKSEVINETTIDTNSIEISSTSSNLFFIQIYKIDKIIKIIVILF